MITCLESLTSKAIYTAFSGSLAKNALRFSAKADASRPRSPAKSPLGDLGVLKKSYVLIRLASDARKYCISGASKRDYKRVLRRKIYEILRYTLVFLFVSLSTFAGENLTKENYSNDNPRACLQTNCLESQAKEPRNEASKSSESFSLETGSKSAEMSEFTDLQGNVVDDFSRETPSAFTPKTPTPSRFFSADLSIPDTFATTNNLAKKTGSFYRAFGEIIFIQGTVTDSFNVPIQGAVIEIWQANAAGKYHTLLESNSEYIDKYFSMSGRAITDNLGNYHFITVMPGSVSGRAPHINMNIYHPKFGKLETEMYFAGHPFNQTDYQYLAYSQEERKLLTANVHSTDIMNSNSIKLCTFNITLKGIHQYKRF